VPVLRPLGESPLKPVKVERAASVEDTDMEETSSTGTKRKAEELGGEQEMQVKKERL
jgi:hypothetical protein